MEGVIMDADHIVEDEQTFVRLYLWKKGWKIAKIPFNHYFYAISENTGIENTEIVERTVGIEKKKVSKVFVKYPGEAHKIKKELERRGIECREYDFSVEKRFFLDTGISPMDYVTVNGTNVKRQRETVDMTCCSIDLEVLTKNKAPNWKKDPIIMISYADTTGFRRVLTTKEINVNFAETMGNEEEMIRRLNDIIKERDPTIIFGYNSDAFDIPYLKKRAELFNLKLKWGIDGSDVAIRRGGGRTTTADVKGRMHIDVYRIVESMASMGAISTTHLDLETVYKALTGKEKIKIEHRKIADEWLNTDSVTLAEYNLQDAEACLELGLNFLPLYIELSKLTHSNLYEVTRMSTSQIVEWKLISEAVKEGKLVPKRPKEDIVRRRLAETYRGGYVREPEQGLHENIVVFDFRSLYPSIIISHNVDPDIVNRRICTEENILTSPAGHFFCKAPKGTLPKALEKILYERIDLKKKMKKMDRNSEEYKYTFAKQQALKIISNSAYGYLGYARARWYSKECAEAITAWAREYIQKVMKLAEKHGFKVIYGDTDSVFCVNGPNLEEKAKEFMNNVNKELPPPMGLELEGIYRRGIFIHKRGERRAAKKKYALVDREGRLKIVGFEYVRRDWAEIAKEVQRKIIELILVQGKPEEAIRYLREVIVKVRKKEYPKEKFVIYTQLQKSLDVYDQKGPHVTAAKKAISRGVQIVPGSIIGYIVKEGGGKISDRAELAEFVKEKEYDAEYYIRNHILPSVLPILEGLGISENEITQAEGQTKLFDFT